MQVIAEPASLPNYESEVKHLTPAAASAIEGEVEVAGARGRPPKLRSTTVHVYGGADPETYPLQKKGHTLEFLREIAHLRPRTNTFGAVIRVRNCV